MSLGYHAVIRELLSTGCLYVQSAHVDYLQALGFPAAKASSGCLTNPSSEHCHTVKSALCWIPHCASFAPWQQQKKTPKTASLFFFFFSFSFLLHATLPTTITVTSVPTGPVWMEGEEGKEIHKNSLQAWHTPPTTPFCKWQIEKLHDKRSREKFTMSRTMRNQRKFVQAHQRGYVCTSANVRLLLPQLANILNVKWFQADCS